MLLDLNLLFMKQLIILFFAIATLSCRTQKENYIIDKNDGYTLPAYHLGKSEESGRIQSVEQSLHSRDLGKVIFEGREYSTKEFLEISHTIDSTYSLNVEVDSLTHEKILIVEKK